MPSHSTRSSACVSGVVGARWVTRNSTGSQRGGVVGSAPHDRDDAIVHGRGRPVERRVDGGGVQLALECHGVGRGRVVRMIPQPDPRVIAALAVGPFDREPVGECGEVCDGGHDLSQSAACRRIVGRASPPTQNRECHSCWYCWSGLSFGSPDGPGGVCGNSATGMPIVCASTTPCGRCRTAPRNV